jgi:predicted permease
VIVLQVACTCVLLLGAALLARSFQSLIGVDRGFDPHNVLTAAIPMPEASYTGARRAEIATNLLARLQTVPGVRAAAVTITLPLMPHELLGGFTMPARNGTGTRNVRAAIRQVSPGYFEALGVRIVTGRPFSEHDTSASQPVVLVNRAFVKQYLDEPAVGQRLPAGEIVGVVEDVRHRGAVDAVQPEVYVAWPQLKEGLTADEPKVVVRTSTDPKALVETLRSLVRAQDASLALDDVGTMEDRVSTNVARPRLYAVLLGGFAGSALLIAAVGLFGVLSYSVAQRTREIGVRTAIGARPADIVGLVVRQGLAMAAWGAALGLGASLALAGYLKGLLFGVTTTDAWSYAIVLGVLLATAAVACALPARRAAKTDPLKALRA